MALFGIGELSQEQIDIINDLHRRTQENPSVYSSERVEAINELKKRIDNRSIQPFAPAKRKLYKGLEVTSEEQQAVTQQADTQPQLNSLTQPDTILAQKEKEDELQESINIKKQQKAEFYTSAIGVNPYEDMEGAYNAWFQGQNQQSLMQIIEDKNISNTAELRESFFKSAEKGTLQEDFKVGGPIEKPEEKPEVRKKPESLEEELEITELEVKEAFPDTFEEFFNNIPGYGDNSPEGIKKRNEYLDSMFPGNIASTLQTETGNYESNKKMAEDAIAEGRISFYGIKVHQTQKERIQEYYETTVLKELVNQRLSDRYGASDVVKNILSDPIEFAKIIPFGSWFEVGELGYLNVLANKLEDDPSSLTDKELKELTDFYEKEQFKGTATYTAEIVEGLSQMPAFMVEMWTGGKIVESVAKKALPQVLSKFLFGVTGKSVEEISKKIMSKKLRDKIKKEIADRTLKVKIAEKTGKFALGTVKTVVGAYTSGDVNASEVRNLMPGALVEGGKIVEMYPGMDAVSAKNQAVVGGIIEFGTERMGGGPKKVWRIIKKTKVGKATGDAFAAAYRKMGLPEKEYVMSLGITRLFRRLNPDASDADVTKVFESLGYHGILEEMYEERLGEGARGIMTKLDEMGMVEGFDNPNWEYKLPTLEQLSQELIMFSVPGLAKKTAEKVVKEKRLEAAIDAAPETMKAVDESDKQVKETKEEYKTYEDKIESEGTNKLDEKKTTRLNELKEKEGLNEEEQEEFKNLSQEKRILGVSSLSKKEQKRFVEIINIKNNNVVLNEIKNLIIKDPKITEGVDFDIELEEEMERTREQLEKKGVTMEGEGLEAGTEKAKVLGWTIIQNRKIQLGLRKGADFDTVVEEYYGAIYKGGLTEKQNDTFEEHYDRYKEDKEYRTEVNEFINDMMSKMGLTGKMIANTSQTLSEQELFEKEGKSYEYKSNQEQKGDIADTVFDYVSSLFKGAFGRAKLSDKVKDIYKKVEKRKQRVTKQRVKRLTERREERKKAREKPKKVKAKERKPKKVKKKKKKDNISYQLSVLEVSKKLASPKTAKDEDKVNVAVSMGLEEVIKAIEESEDGIIHEALQWYFTSVDQTMDIASSEVDIEDKVDELTFKAIIALNSPQTRPDPNYNYAIEIFKYYQENGTFNYKPTKKDPNKIRLHSFNKKGEEKIVGGKTGLIMTNAHQKLEFLFEKFGKEKALNWMLTKHTGKEIFEVLKEFGQTTKPDHILLTEQEGVLPMYYGSRIFGRKVGSFFANIEGKSDVATYDLWWSRTWNRWLGTPVTVNQKTGEVSIQDKPRNNKEAAMMDEAINRIADALTETTGYKFTPPAIQAILWYYEKKLYIKNDALSELGVDFLRAAQNRAKEKGYATTPTGTKRARRVTQRRIAKEKRDTASLKEGIKKTGKKARQKAPQVSYQLTDVNIPAQESKPSYQLQVADINKIKDCPPGQCYRNAVRAAQKNPGSKVVQGRVYMPRYDEMKGHSWMEIENIVYDPAIDLVVKKEDFYNAVKNLDPSGVGIEVINELNPTTASILSLREGYKEYTAKEISEVESGKPPTKAKISYQLTPTQTEFFKDSVVREPNGDLTEVFHGTSAKDFESFDPMESTGDWKVLGDGAYFSDNPHQASDYATRKKGEGAPRVIPAYLNIKNPFVLEGQNLNRKVDIPTVPTQKEIKHMRKAHSKVWGGSSKGYWYDIWNRLPSDMKREVLMDLGYDGIYDGTVWVAFNPEQIKSQFNIEPTTDPRISYQLEPTGLKTLYHVTPTKNLSTIKRVGLIPFQDTLWTDDEGNRLGDGSIFAFESLKDAQVWKRKIIEDPGLPFDDATILKIDNKDDRWNEDVLLLPSGKIIPMNVMGPDAGRWFKRNETVKPENISVVDEAKPSYQLEPTLFSPALRLIENLQAKSLKRRGLLKLFKRYKVPKAELDWLGVMEWARENYKPHESIPKQDIIDYIKANQSEVIDVTLGRKDFPDKVGDWVRMETIEDKAHYSVPGWTYIIPHDYEEASPYYIEEDSENTFVEQDNFEGPRFPEELIEGDQPKFEKFTMVGGENYKELLVQHPDATFIRPSHWNIPGIIVSLRLTTRFDTEGNKTLFIEEIQSDWTSQAWSIYNAEVRRVANELAKSWINLPSNKRGDTSKKLSIKNGVEYANIDEFIPEAKKKVPIDFGYKEVGDTPYKHTTKEMAWIKLGVKKAIMHAVENNFDKIAVPTHEQIADMFDVSKQISTIRYKPIDPNAKRSDVGYGRFQTFIFDKNGHKIKEIPQYNTPEQLEEFIGKGIVDKMLAGEGSPSVLTARQRSEGSIYGGTLVLSGLDLRTPARFHKLVYDALANILAKQGRSLGGRPGTTDIVIEPNAMMAELDTRNPIIPQDLKDKQEYEEVLTSKASVDNFVKEGKGIPVKRKSLDLTDKLKDTVNKTGLPSFQLQPVEQPLDLPDETLRQIFIRKVVNRLNRLEQVVDLVGNVDDETNAYLQAVLFEGRAESRIDNFNEWVEDYLKKLNDAEFTIEDIGEYLYAKHAIERNKKAHDDDPKFEGTGSGMTNKEAREIIKRFKGSGIHKFATQFYKKVIKGRLDILLEGGLITQETYDFFSSGGGHVFKNYVPLKGTSKKKKIFGTGTRGFSVEGKDIVKMRGRNSRSNNPFVQSIVDYEMAIIRSEKNKVSQKLYKFLKENPSESWEVKGRKYIPRYNKEGEPETFDPLTLQANQVSVFIDGKLKVITIHDEALLRAMQKLGTGTTFKFAHKFNTYLRAIYTTYNPEFLITNFERDIQTALINIQAQIEGGLPLFNKLSAQIMKDLFTFGPQSGILKGLRGWQDSEWKKWYEEYKSEGGSVGWFASKTVEEKIKELEKIMKRKQSSLNPKSLFRYLGKWVNDMNSVVEQAVRLSTYKNLREGGLTKQQAAKIARELTVNFNQKGEWGSVINSLWLFSNASIQGNFIMIRAFRRSKKVKAICLGIVLQTIILNMLNRMNGGDDWEKYSDWEKDNNWLYVLPNGDVLKFRVPYGYNIFHVIGNVTEELIMGDITYGQAMGRVLESFITAFSPFGTGEGVSQYMPTLYGFKQSMELMMNETFWGGPIYPEKPYQTKGPDSQLFFEHRVSPQSRAITTWLNNVTGGNEIESGWVDISPATLDHLYEAFTGQTGKFIERSYRTGKQLFKDGKVEKWKDVPILRQIIGEPYPYTTYYKMRDLIDESGRVLYSDEVVEQFEKYYRLTKEDDVIEIKQLEKLKKKFYNNQDALKERRKKSGGSKENGKKKGKTTRYKRLYP